MIVRLLFLLVLVAACQADVVGSTPLRLTVMTFNVWGAGSNDSKSVEETVAVIRSASPDIVGLQEVRRQSPDCNAEHCPAFGPSVAPAIATALGYFLYEQTRESDALWANAILSRYPLTRSTQNDLGVVIDIGEREVAMFNIHLTDYPYQPYQLLGIPYADAPFLSSEADAIAAAREARGSALKVLMKDVASVGDVDATFVVGDFNEPSHRDWTPRAAEFGRHPMSVRFPTARKIEMAGFKDTYRSVFVDEISAPGFTWTPTTSSDDKSDHHDRIDYVFVRPTSVEIESAAVVGERSPESDLVVEPWPSDHRAVVVTISIP